MLKEKTELQPSSQVLISLQVAHVKGIIGIGIVPKRQGFSHREADEKSLLDEAFRRVMGGASACAWDSGSGEGRLRDWGGRLSEKLLAMRAAFEKPRSLWWENAAQGCRNRRCRLLASQVYGTP
jgi:hypothetical protein